MIYRIYFYDVHRKLVNNKNATSAIEFEGLDYQDKFSLYVNSWLNMKYYLSKKEIEAFTQEIDKRFIQLLPKRNDNRRSDGNHKMDLDITYKFEVEIANIFENGLKQVKDLREKKLFNF